MVLGKQNNAQDIYQEYWETQGFKSRNEAGSKVSMPVQDLLSEENQEVLKEKKGMVRKAMAKQVSGTEAKAMDETTVSGSTPLIFDPEILSILKQNAPLMDVVPMEGQQGFTAVHNRIDSRDEPIGFTSESDAIDLSDNSANDISFTKTETDMEIYVDLAEISDFTQAAADHYMNVEDTTLGERVALHAQRKEQQILYGDNSLDTKTGGLGDADSYDGLATKFNSAGNQIDKSGTSSSFIKDIKSEIHTMLQTENVTVNNLVIATSHEFFSVLEDEADFDNLRTDPSDRSVDVGLNTLLIKGVPVIPTHNVDLQQEDETVDSTDTGANEIVVPNDYTGVLSGDDTFDVDGTTFTVESTSYDSGNNQTTITVDSVSSGQTGNTATFDIAGDPGDVFIFSTRAVRFRALVPFSTVPLAKQGLAETTALFEFGALIEKSGGNFGRHLQAYDF